MKKPYQAYRKHDINILLSLLLREVMKYWSHTDCEVERNKNPPKEFSFFYYFSKIVGTFKHTVERGSPFSPLGLVKGDDSPFSVLNI